MVSPDPSASAIRKAHVAAHMYFVQQRTMQAIATEFRTSRSTISRLLTLARETGIVTIQIQDPFEVTESIAAELAARFRVRPEVIPMPDDGTQRERLTRVAVAAAHRLQGLVEAAAVVGIAWGSTVAEVSRQLLPKPIHGVTIVQLNGSGNHHSSGLSYASDILSRFAAAFEGTAQQFPVPAFFDSPSTKTAMWRERSTRRILDLQAQMDLVVFSVGAAEAESPSHVYSAGYLDAEDAAALRSADVVGDVATVFYRIDGSGEELPLNRRATGPALDVLRRVPTRLCVVADPGKARSLRGALAAGLVTDLVVDEGTAKALLEA